jgi:hypothetical protein
LTIYLELWYKVIATPRYDKKVADKLRLAHNHLLQRRAKSTVAGEFGVDVSRLENGKATGMRVTSPPVTYTWE